VKKVKGIYIITVEYACGSEVGFATRNIEQAARKAAEIMTDVCPECKLKMGEPLTEDEKEMLIVGKATGMTHKEAQRN
jgi:hypothetical protein